MFSKFSTNRASSKPAVASDSPELAQLGPGKGSLLFKNGAFGKWKPFWFELSGDALMQYNKRGESKPRHVYRLMGAMLKDATQLTGEEGSFAVFLPNKEPLYFRATNNEQRVSWMASLTTFCASTEWSTSSMVMAFIDPVVVASQEGLIIEVNDAMLSMFGYKRDQVVGRNLKMLMPANVAQFHDGYLKSYLQTGVNKLVGKPRALTAQHADGSPLAVVLSLGVEANPNGTKMFIGTLRADTEKRNMLTKLEMDMLLQKTVESALGEASTKIKTSLSAELDGVMKRLEEYQASYKMNAARLLKERAAGMSATQTEESDMDNSGGGSAPNTQNQKKQQTISVDISKIVVGQQLGMGGSGCAVYAANVDGWDCAMKELKLANAKQSDVDGFMAEMLLLESLPNHKNIVRFLFHQRTSDRIRIFMRRYETTLESYLKRLNGKNEYFELSEVASYALDVIRALEILHDYKIIHRDLKSQNLFVNFDMAGKLSHLTLSDFDSAKVVENADAAKTIIGTIGWMPPEVYASAGKSYTFSADIWSFGMVMFELMDLGRPFADVDEFERVVYIGDGKLPRFRAPELVKERYGGLLPIWTRCCALDPTARPSLHEIKMEISRFL